MRGQVRRSWRSDICCSRVRRDRVDSREMPIGKGALHDLEPLRNPIDAREDRLLVTGYGLRTHEVQLDLSLDTKISGINLPGLSISIA
jgi:hypothetical protein